MMEVICNTVVFQEGKLTRLMVDFEKGMCKPSRSNFLPYRLLAVISIISRPCVDTFRALALCRCTDRT